jgi:hypothetical protein
VSVNARLPRAPCLWRCSAGSSWRRILDRAVEIIELVEPGGSWPRNEPRRILDRPSSTGAARRDQALDDGPALLLGIELVARIEPRRWHRAGGASRSILDRRILRAAWRKVFAKFPMLVSIELVAQESIELVALGSPAPIDRGCSWLRSELVAKAHRAGRHQAGPSLALPRAPGLSIYTLQGPQKGTGHAWKSATKYSSHPPIRICGKSATS